MITKTYRIEDILFTELSPRKGSIEYFLIDSVGNKRKVTGIARLGFTGKIKSVKAVYHRETPMIDALIEADIDHRITVDFTDFNEKNPRVSSGISTSQRSKGGISATMMYQEYYNDMNYGEKIKNVLPDMSKLGFWSVFLFIIWMAFMAVDALTSIF